MGGGNSKLARERFIVCKSTGGTELNLRECELKELGVFKEILKFKNLGTLDLSKNYLLQLPPSIKQMVNLEVLDLSSNALEGEVPYELCTLRKLRVLRLNGNYLTGFPALFECGRMEKLQELSLGSNKITTLPADFGKLTSLVTLNLDGFQLLGIPGQLMQLTRLRRLILSRNRITLPSPEGSNGLEPLVGLEELSLDGNELAILQPTLCVLTNLQRLELGANKITKLPDEINQLTKLRYLGLANCQLASLSNMVGSNFPALEELDASHNRLTAVPSEVDAFAKLRVLDLSTNELASLPREIGYLGSELRKLRLQSNRLEMVPGELQFLGQGVDIDLNSNPLKPPFSQYMIEGGVRGLIDNLRPYVAADYRFCSFEGAGMLRAQAGTPTEFKIIARDRIERPRTTGGDAFVLNFVPLDEVNGVLPPPFDGIVKDMKDGTYTVFYNIKQTGRYSYSVKLNGQHVQGSPSQLEVFASILDAQNSRVTGKVAMLKLGNPIEFVVEGYDRFGNRVAKGGERLEVRVEHDHLDYNAQVSDMKNGTYNVTFMPSEPGAYVVNVALINGEKINQGDWCVNVS